MLVVHRLPMRIYPTLSLWILVITAVTLFWVALTDLREFKVRNEFVAILVVLYLLHALCSGAWVSMQWNFAFALLMLLGGAYAYSLQQIGGGDLKLLAVAFLWTGPWFAAPFVVLLADFYRAHTISQPDLDLQRRSRPRPAYGFRWRRRWQARSSERLRWVL